MVDWRALEPLTAEGLEQMAVMAVRETRGVVDRSARLSHVGFRSHNRLEWETLMTAMAGMGEVCRTFKADGREIPFVKLHKPLTVVGGVLGYLEFPMPKEVVEERPDIVVAYQITGENRDAKIYGGYEVREQALGAEDFIAQAGI